jgi:hypothetical protein
MTDARQDQERVERDHDRSEEAHWQVAEAAAEKEEERLSETRQSPGRQEGRESEDREVGRDR